jgi:tagatose-6-phosphate ketose/aldose isomerase
MRVLAQPRRIGVFGFSQQQIDDAGAHWTAREILQQPSLWTGIAKSLAQEAGRLQGFLAPILEREGARIILTGAGTSAFIGECLAPALTAALGRRVEAIATTDIVAGPASVLVAAMPTLLVSFGRSGNSPESVAAVNLVSQLVEDCRHLVITCNAEGALYRNAVGRNDSYAILLPEESHDRSFAMTSSFTGMLLAAAIAFKGVAPNAASGSLLGQLASAVLPEALPRLRALADGDFQRIIYLGSRELAGLARESALKMLELTDGKVVAVADSTLGFRHGPKTILNGHSLVVVFLGNDPYTRRFDEDLVAELRADKVALRVVTLSAHPTVGSVEDDLVLSRNLSHADAGAAGALSGLELCLPYAMFAQSLAMLRSMRLGLTPDLPNVGGQVSRVVQGVSIYPWPR